MNYILSGAVASATTVNSGGSEFVGALAPGGISISGFVNRGGVEFVIDGGAASGTVVSGIGAVENVLVLGFASGTKVDSGAAQNVSGGLAISTTINAGGVQYVASDTSHDIGKAFNTTLSGGHGINGAAEQNVSAGGEAQNTVIFSDGFQYVSSGGVAKDTRISGGQMIVYSGALAGDTLVAASGSLLVYGSESFAVVGSGGIENVYSAGTDSHAVVNSGGFQFVYGTTILPTVEFGGTEVIEPGGTLSDGYALIDGGTLVLSAGAIVVGAIAHARRHADDRRYDDPERDYQRLGAGRHDRSGRHSRSTTAPAPRCLPATYCRSPRTATPTICISIRRRISAPSSSRWPRTKSPGRSSPSLPPRPNIGRSGQVLQILSGQTSTNLVASATRSLARVCA